MNTESFGYDSESNEKEERRRALLDTRDKYKEHSSELDQRIAEIQAAKYETALYRLMMRTGDDAELINALNSFLDALDHRSRWGKEDERLHEKQVEKLAAFFHEKADELRYIEGNRPAE